MNSSTSISEPVPEAAWSGVLRRYAVASLVVGVLAAALIVALDPYDTGRLTLLGSRGVPNFGQRLTAASLARAHGNEAAIVGNSTIQLIDPARLGTLTGLRFVSLAIPATGPIEQLTVARWLIHHHTGGQDGALLRALVIGLDRSWCANQVSAAPEAAFPFWLYSDSDLEYVRHLVNLRGLAAAFRKLKVILHLQKPLRSDGYIDFESELAPRAAAAADLAKGTRPIDAPSSATFPAALALRELISAAPSTAVVVLVFVPRYVSTLPVPGSAAEAQQERCQAAFRDVAASRSRTVVIDFLRDDEIARDAANFWDSVHYRQHIARVIEDAIAGAVTASR